MRRIRWTLSNNAHAAADQPYPDTRMLVDALCAQTPRSTAYLVDDGFNRIVLYDNKAISATSQKMADGKYKVTLNVQARKVQADGNGVETPHATGRLHRHRRLQRQEG